MPPSLSSDLRPPKAGEAANAARRQCGEAKARRAAGD
jgi:hypothetical protein